MFNAAWILYAAAGLSLVALTILPEVPRLPNLPDAGLPLTVERSANTSDEYTELTAR